MKNNVIVLCKGLPASGKDTWADEQVKKSDGKLKKINKDMLRLMIDANKWSGDREKFILKLRNLFINQCMLAGYSVIISDTNLHPKHEKYVRQVVEDWNKQEGIKGSKLEYTVEVNDSFLQVPYGLCVKRDLARPNSVGEKVIRQMYIQYVLKVEKIQQDKNLPRAIICDLDGTLCLFGNKNPYERDFENDVVNESVKQILDMYIHHPYACAPRILFLSGRSGKYEQTTREWISRKIGLPNKTWELYMRKEGDSRSDVIVKKELFDEHVRDKYHVDFVIDDRLQILDLWRSLGIFTFSVNQTNEEF